MKIDDKMIYVYWDTTRACNFRCPYCFFISGLKDAYVDSKFDYKKILPFFYSLKNVTVNFTGGEPFLLPNFNELCQELTKIGNISIITNLASPNVYQFSELIDPNRVNYLNCSLHITERERLHLIDDFIGKFNLLKRKGFKIYTVQVMWPPIFERFEEIYKKFLEKGVVVHPGIFRGEYQNKNYPAAYSPEELNLLHRYQQLASEKDPETIKLIMKEADDDFLALREKGELSFKGIPCLAGMKSIRILPFGDVVRCESDSEPLGNIYKGKIKLFTKPVCCRVNVCCCAWEGFKFAQGKAKIYSSGISNKCNRLTMIYNAMKKKTPVSLKRIIKKSIKVVRGY